MISEKNHIFTEVAVPGIIKQNPGSDFRLNVSFEDHDDLNNTDPSVLYWRPRWGSPLDYAGSGTFKLK